MSGRSTADAGEHTHEQFLELYLANISQHTRHALRTTPGLDAERGSFLVRRHRPTVDHPVQPADVATSIESATNPRLWV
ncbi:MAG: hypothetical protein JO212_11875 [Acetobacteraceae bacterium]|nr:hypothetical protein [Acetobacteraceae bacterium]